MTDIRDQYRQAGVPFFFKQSGGKNKKKSGRLLQGRTWDQMPRSAALPSASWEKLSAPTRLR